MDLARRSALAARIQALGELPARVTDALFARHPAWATRFGEDARARCTEDARHHLSFLAGAVQSGSADVFAEYAAWAGAMAEARNLERSHLAEHFELLGAQLVDALPAEAAFLESFPAAALARLSTLPPALEQPPDARTPTRLAYLTAALAGRRAEALDVTRAALRAGWSIRDVYLDLLLAAQRRLGELWARGEISVVQGHLASVVTQWVMPQLFPEVAGDPTLGRALLVGVAGELHALPVHFIADLLQMEGWDARLLGTHVPTPAILSAIAEHQPRVLGVSVTMVFNLPQTVALVGAVQESFPALRVVLGGRALRGAPHLGDELGVEVDTLGDLAPFRAGGP